MNKQDIRRLMLEKRNSLSAKQIEVSSIKIANKIVEHDSFISAKTILFYYPIRNEVDLLALLNENISKKTICLPRVEKKAGVMSARLVDNLDELKKDKFGILSPLNNSIEITPDKIDFIIIPMVAFDEGLNRIGYGSGYYDRYLKKCINAFKCGVAYSFQKTNDIIAELYDMKMDLVVTDI